MFLIKVFLINWHCVYLSRMTIFCAVDVQSPSKVYIRFRFYDMIWGNFDKLKIPLKVLKTYFSLLIPINIDQIFPKTRFLALKAQDLQKCKPSKLVPSRIRTWALGSSKSSNSLHKLTKNVASTPKCLIFFFQGQLWQPVVL